MTVYFSLHILVENTSCTWLQKRRDIFRKSESFQDEQQSRCYAFLTIMSLNPRKQHIQKYTQITQTCHWKKLHRRNKQGHRKITTHCNIHAVAQTLTQSVPFFKKNHISVFCLFPSVTFLFSFVPVIHFLLQHPFISSSFLSHLHWNDLCWRVAPRHAIHKSMARMQKYTHVNALRGSNKSSNLYHWPILPYLHVF